MTPNLNENFLLDDFHKSGRRQEDFEDLIRMIDKHTRCGQYLLKNLTLFSLDEKQPDPKRIFGCVIPPQSPLVYRKAVIKGGTMTVPSVDRGFLAMEQITTQGNFGALLKEAMSNNRIMLYNKELSGDQMAGVFMSKLALKTLAQRLGLKVKPLVQHSLERDLFLASLMDQDTEVTVVTKTFKNMSKVFAVLGSEFVNTNLFLICELYSVVQEEARYGAMECVDWDITHKRARITFRFPDLAKTVWKKYGLKEPMEPYVEYVSSDTGEQSLQVRIYWLTKSGDFIPGSIYQRRHRGHFERFKKFKEEIDQAVFDCMMQIPDLFKQLMSIRISPDGFDPDSPRWMGRNHKRALRAFRYMMKAAGVSSIIGKKRQMRLDKVFDFAVIKDEEIYTAYEILMDFCTIPALVKTHTNDPKWFAKEEKNLPETSEEGDRKLKEYCIARALELDFGKIRAYAAQTTPDGSGDDTGANVPDGATAAAPDTAPAAGDMPDEATGSAGEATQATA